MTAHTDPAGVARGLSAAQRDAVSGAYEFEGQFYHDGADRTGRSLLARGIVTMGGVLTPLGLAVRACLITPDPAPTETPEIQ